jgi:hypothetical protein
MACIEQDGFAHDREFRTSPFRADAGRDALPRRSRPAPMNGLGKWLEIDTFRSAEWPNDARKKDSPADADGHKGEEDRFDGYFSADPGEGD